MSPSPNLSLKELILARAAEQVHHDLAKSISLVVDNAREQGQPFIVEWRQPANPHRREREYDAGCGCGPIEDFSNNGQ